MFDEVTDLHTNFTPTKTFLKWLWTAYGDTCGRAASSWVMEVRVPVKSGSRMNAGGARLAQSVTAVPEASRLPTQVLVRPRPAPSIHAPITANSAIMMTELL